MNSFVAFSAQYRASNSSMGDLARAIEQDTAFPVEATEWPDILHYLHSARASDRMLHAAKTLYKLYRKEVRKHERKQPVCDG